MSRREYMADAAVTWLGMGSSLQKLSEMRECFGKTAKSDMGESDLDPVFDGIAAMADCCLNMATKCVKYAKAEEAEELRKAHMGADGPEPSPVSLIYSQDNLQNLRMVSRPGSPQAGDLTKLENTVAPGLEKFVSLD